MKDFRKLKVWDRSHRLAIAVYGATTRFPRSEVFGLTSQMRRAAVSIPSNLAEGCGRRTDAELSRFSDIALGSASELEYQILLARDLGYLDEASAGLGSEVVEVKRMLGGFIRQLGRASRDVGAASG
ncbi:MAG: four helix bundle protein [Chloroflexi bacterium]|nr:four helix bundle protein [Chloroflexota bacterium]